MDLRQWQFRLFQTKYSRPPGASVATVIFIQAFSGTHRGMKLRMSLASTSHNAQNEESVRACVCTCAYRRD